jgi:hypothetical protein
MCPTHSMWTWDPSIIFGGIQLLLEDKQYSSREDCNVPCCRPNAHLQT